MFSPNSIFHGAVKLCRSRRGKSKNISIKQRGGTMLPLTVASLYLGQFVANGSEFFESGEHVIALGSYSGRARRSGKRFTARFVHVWTLQDGLIVRLQQCADTVQLTRALADENETTA